MKCSCARTEYRNHRDGTRDYRIKGQSSCPKCHGYGRLLKCGVCDGCGLRAGNKCTDCGAHGVLPDRRPYPYSSVPPSPRRSA